MRRTAPKTPVGTKSCAQKAPAAAIRSDGRGQAHQQRHKRMSLVKRVGQFRSIAHMFVHHAVLQFPRGEPLVGLTQEAKFLGTIEVVDDGPHRLGQAAQELWQYFVGERVLKAAEPRHECIGSLGFVDVDAQGRCSICAEGNREQAPVRLEQMPGLEFDCLEQENKSSVRAHNATPVANAAA